jgi:hypothetical protein
VSFKSVQGNIEKKGYSKQAAGAILAKSTRDASPAAKKANPNLKKVKPAKKKATSTSAKPQWAGIADKMLGKNC